MKREMAASHGRRAGADLRSAGNVYSRHRFSSLPACLLIPDASLAKVTLSFRARHTLGRLSDRATVARWTRARTRARLDSRGAGVARTKGGDRVCSDNQGRLA